MSWFFEFDGKECMPKAEILLVEPFAGMWKKDRKKALKDFTFAELYTSKSRSNPYAGYSDEVRMEKLGLEVYGKRGMLFSSLDDDVKKCVEKLEEFQTQGSVTWRYYMSQVRAAEKLISFFDDFNLNERNEKLAPIYKPKEITSALADADKIMQNLTSLRAKVEQEMFDAVKGVAGREIGMYEE